MQKKMEKLSFAPNVSLVKMAVAKALEPLGDMKQLVIMLPPHSEDAVEGTLVEIKHSKGIKSSKQFQTLSHR